MKNNMPSKGLFLTLAYLLLYFRRDLGSFNDQCVQQYEKCDSGGER